MIVNLIFHQIHRKESDVTDIYNTHEAFLVQFLDRFLNGLAVGEFNFSDFRVYFDDGTDSYKKYVHPKLSKFLKQRVVIAVVTEWIDTPGYLTKSDLKHFHASGVTVVSHSASHPGMASFRKGKLIRTPPGGVYTTAPYGQGKILTMQQVRYQMIESKAFLEDLLSVKVEEFVFPHGLYNADIVTFNCQSGLYSNLSTCEEFLDEGQLLRPRFLIRSDRTVEENINLIRALGSYDEGKVLTVHNE